MATAITVEQYLDEQRLPYEVLTHEHTSSSRQTARAAHIDPEQLVKAVLLDDERGRRVMAVLPASRVVRLGEMRRQFGHDFGMATERAAAEAFRDCEPGAIPPLGPAYGVETIWDDSLMNACDVFFEAGDHRHLVHMSAVAFLGALQGCRHGAFSEPV
jgi:Ala-tRNA(Pro) deacylase